MNIWPDTLIAAMDSRDQAWIMVSLAVLAALVVIAFIVIRSIRRRLHAPSEDSPFGSSFSLEQLRQLHQQGTISDEEYESLRDSMFTDTDPT
jgi:uncharacterized membrane protein